ncbi:VTT domain-containing protein [Exiguobacterium sp. s138]|uniref:TVP38/TMEM64 family protein n=1 Tax=Exiguobacterium sp. s138 TaxID=2751202 RepID=UPI001BEBFB86|nr:VTT domain-containing protein [Exiguobacterium sp. s138]
MKGSLTIEATLLDWLQRAEMFAVPISLLVSIIISLFGVLPSAFVTAANLLYFGFWQGLMLSFLGEALGAGVAFYVYRYGIRRVEPLIQSPFILKWLEKLTAQTGWDAFWTIIFLRLLPFAPSGLVTFLSATSGVSPVIFLTASTIGKVPALVIEAFAVNELIERDSMLPWLIVGLFAVFYLMYLYKKRLHRSRDID